VLESNLSIVPDLLNSFKVTAKNIPPVFTLNRAQDSGRNAQNNVQDIAL
jgi:hypothetical protein